MSRKKKILKIFLVTFFIVTIFNFWFMNSFSQDLSLSKTDALVGSISSGVSCALTVIVFYYLWNGLRKLAATGRDDFDINSIPYQTDNGIPAFPKLYFTTDIGQSIFDLEPCTAFLYEDKILFRCNEKGYERAVLELSPERMVGIQRYSIQKTEQIIQHTAMRLTLSGPIKGPSGYKKIKAKYWRADIFYKIDEENTALIGIEDTMNSKTCYSLCEKMAKLYGTTIADIKENEAYAEHNKL